MKISQVIATALSFAWCTIPAREAKAYVYKYYDGCFNPSPQPLRWLNDVNIMARNRCSIPLPSDEGDSYYNAGWQWLQIATVIDPYYYWDDCWISLGDGFNGTALVSTNDIGGAVGLTSCIVDPGCTMPDTFHPQMVECDIKMANEYNFYNPDESGSDQSNLQWGRVALLHEWGHVLNLDHQAGFDIMNPGPPVPYAGGTGDHTEPFPDDANGVRNLYSISFNETNLFASAFTPGTNGLAMTGNPIGTVSVTVGQFQTIRVTVANNGNTAANNYNLRIFINSQPPNAGFTGGTDLVNWNSSSTAGSYWSQDFNVFVPNVTDGLYWIYWMADTGHVYSEWNEDDNAVHSAMTWQIHH